MTMDDENTMTFLKRAIRNQRQRDATVQACIDQRAIEAGACLRCSWQLF